MAFFLCFLVLLENSTFPAGYAGCVMARPLALQQVL